MKSENVKTSTLSIPMFKSVLEKGEIDSSCLVLTIRENASVMVERIENKALNVIRNHIGDFESLSLKGEQRVLPPKSTQQKPKPKKDENYAQNKLNNEYIDFLRFCFSAFYDKTSTEAKSDIFEVI